MFMLGKIGRSLGIMLNSQTMKTNKVKKNKENQIRGLYVLSFNHSEEQIIKMLKKCFSLQMGPENHLDKD